MNETAKILFGKAVDDIDAAKTLLPKPNQHDNAGAHLSKAVEKLAKAFLEGNDVPNVPKTGNDGHNLRLLFRMLQEAGFPIGKYVVLQKLQIYDSRAGYNYIDEGSQLNLKSIVSLVEEFKKEVLSSLSKRKS